jgi:hypothetical protein
MGCALWAQPIGSPEEPSQWWGTCG